MAAAVSAEDFKGALGSWASGVTVVTTRLDEEVYGITVSSFSSLSMEPRLILVSLQDSNHLPHMIKKSRRFGVSILAMGQDDVSAYFSTSGRNPSATFDDPVRAEVMTTGSPLISGALAHIDCELEQALPGGDHTIAIGRVVGASFNAEKLPLMYFRRAYRSLNME
ncbi:MAG: flavin reductase family protein [Dehalococcoidia bacterium]|nr:flavin reductase family protein [Dehalococcoidia bacterium]